MYHIPYLFWWVYLLQISMKHVCADLYTYMMCTFQTNPNGVQVKDPSKAASASDADIKDLVQFRGEELKKDTLAEAKTDNKRYDQVALSHMLCVSMYTSLLDRLLLCGLQNFHRE